MAAKKKAIPPAAVATPSELAGVDLKRFILRTHPGYDDKLGHWSFCRASYLGGREWFDYESDNAPEKPNLFKFYKEGVKEYGDRVDRTYRANHTKRVVDTVNQYLFRTAPVRSSAANALIKKFWSNADGKGGSMNRFAKDMDRWMSVYGRIWVGVDRHNEIANTRAEERLPYAYIVSPEKVLDFSVSDEDGKLNWILLEEEKRDEDLAGTGGYEDMWRLWTREAWYLIRKGDKKAGEAEYVIDSAEFHDLGVVPFVSISETDDNKYCSPALVDDIVYMDRTLVNYGSLLDEILYEQTFSTLTLPVEGVVPGSADYTKIINASKNRLFLYASTAAGGKPEYISPHVEQANLIVSAMMALKKDIYAVTGTDNDASTQSMSKGKEYASGKVREFDHKQIENILLDKARALELGEERIMTLVLIWMGDKSAVDEGWVTYPDKFDVRGLAAELDIASVMNELKLPPEMMRRQVKLVAAKSFTRMTDKEKSELDTIIDKWMPGYSQEMALKDREVGAKEETADAAMIIAEKPVPAPVAKAPPTTTKPKKKAA